MFYAERLASLSGTAKLDELFIDYARQNLYVTASGMYSHNYLQRSVEIIGTDRILFSSDFPYQHQQARDARNFLEAANLGNKEKKNLFLLIGKN